VTNPAGERMSFTYDENGLLLSSRDPRGGESHYQYAGFGSLVQAQDRAGANKTLVRTNGSNGLYFVNLTSGSGRQTRYQMQRFDSGARFVARRDPSGEITVNSWEQDGSQKTFLPDGSSVSLTPAPDPRWGLIGPIAGSSRISTPSGLTREVATQRSVLLTNSNDPLALSSILDTVTVNGRDFVRTYDAANRQYSLRSPEGRVRKLSLNEKGRPTTIEIAGLSPIELGYDDLGRLISMARGGGEERRTLTFEYNDQGRLAKVNGPLSRSVQLEYDEAGRISRQIDQNGKTVAVSYDSNGNLTAITPPGKPLHQFDFTPVDLLAAYNPPALGTGVASTSYSYNLDHRLTQISRPDGRSVGIGYDTGGRLETVFLSDGALRLSYDSFTGHLASLSSPDGETIAYAYDGFLPTGATWTGPVSGSVARTYDNNFHLVSMSVNGADPISFQYDQDALLVQVGGLMLQRNAKNGLLTGTVLGEVATAQSYNGFGEISDFQASLGATPLYAASYSYDKLGRITEKIETLENVTGALDYHYDSVGRLTDVVRDGTAVAHYDYDENGNRTSETGPAGTVTSIYDAQDHLLQHGDVTYTYSANGELATKAQNGLAVTYSYDELGSLRQVSLPSGITIDYVIDGRGRRVGKRVNGILVQGFLYNDLQRPVAEIDGGGRVVSQFIYGSQDNVPDYMVRNGVKFLIVSDHLGSPRLIVSSETGEIAQRVDYDAFGRVTLDTNPGFQPFGFAGGLYDYQTGLVRFGARDYDAETGRWTTKDALLFGGGGSNLYQYCDSDPVNWIDPDGLNNRKPGKTPPNSWPTPPETVVGKKPRWNSDGYWDGKGGRKCTWDSRSHGSNVDRGKGVQGGHWDDENSDNRWDEDGNLLPGSPDLETSQRNVVRNIQWGLVAAGGALIVATIAEDFLTGGIGIADDPETVGAGIALIAGGFAAQELPPTNPSSCGCQ
jgi:RHS repeat-associated protein